MENTNEVVMENEQEVKEVEVVKKEGIMTRIGNAIKKTGKAIKDHPVKAGGIFVGATAVVVGTVVVIKKVIDAKNGETDGIEVVDTIEELVDKVKDQISDGANDIPFDGATDVVTEIAEGVTE